jgi:hypothetical protein
MNESIKTSLEENPNASPKVFSCKLVQQKFLQLLVRKDPIIEGDILQGDVLLEVLENVSPLANENKVRNCFYTYTHKTFGI